MSKDLGDDGLSRPDAPPGPQFLEGLSRVRHGVYQDTAMLVAIDLRFVQGSVLVQVDPDTDEVITSFDDAAIDAEVDEVSWLDVSTSADYRDVIGSDTLWRWHLVNQQGYRDGFQIELEQRGSDNKATSTATFQYLALASEIEVRRVSQVKAV